MDWEQLEKELKEFDYTYEMSDDGRVWRSGVREEARVQALVNKALAEDKKRTEVLVSKYQHQFGTRFIKSI